MISMWCSGFKSNMQNSYLHVSMVTLTPSSRKKQDRVSEIDVLPLTFFLAEERGKVLKRYQEPRQNSTLELNSSGSISKS